MMMPQKEMTEQELARWEDALSSSAFKDRMAKFNKSQERKLQNTFTSKAKKWRDYYGHDSGKSRFVIYEPSRTDKVNNRMSPADVFVKLQQENVTELISRESCPHEDAEVEYFSREVDVGYRNKATGEVTQERDYSVPFREIEKAREPHTIGRETCKRCGLVEETDLDATETPSTAVV